MKESPTDAGQQASSQLATDVEYPRKRQKLSSEGESKSPSGSINAKDASPRTNGAKGSKPKSALVDRSNWEGFCEIESDPAFLNVMMREWGVRGAKVREIFSLDDLGADYLPKPVYGLIFCYRYFEPDYEKQEKACPDHIWFANQIAPNSCASVAMINILNNVPGLVLGENLQTFKNFSRSFHPYSRGEALANFQFVKRIHNSFANRIEMANADLFLKNKYDEAMKAKKQTARSTGKGKGKGGTPRKSKKLTRIEDSDETPYHYQAFMPINGELWKLDGMDWQPEKLGSFTETEDWTAIFAPILQEKIALLVEQYGCEVNLMCIHKDPAATIREDLAQNILSLSAINKRLDESLPDWPSFLSEEDMDVLLGPSEELHIDNSLLSTTVLSEATERRIRGDDQTMLLDFRKRIAGKQVELRNQLQVATFDEREDEQKAQDRRTDFGPFIRAWLEELAKTENLKEIAEEVRTG